MRHRHEDTLHDELEIERLIAVYCDGVVRHDAHTWASVWADEGARWEIAGSVFEGRDSIVDHWRMAMASFRHVFHTATNGILDIDGDRATGRWFVVEHNVRRDDTVAEMRGYYDDRYARTANRWRVQSRVLTMIDRTGH